MTDEHDAKQPKVSVAQPLSPGELAATVFVESCLNTINVAQQVTSNDPVVQLYFAASAAQAQMVLGMLAQSAAAARVDVDQHRT